MLDIKFIRSNPDIIKKAIKNRGMKLDIDVLLKADETRRDRIQKLDSLRQKKNEANNEITALLKQKKDPKGKIKKMKVVAEEISKLEAQTREINGKLKGLLLNVPNIPHESLPVGDAKKNKVVRSWGKIEKFDFKPLTHLQIVEHLDIIDFNRAAKISGSNFILYKKDGARLERALINFMLDLHTKEGGYTEIFPPFLVNRAAMTGTGQLPKLEEDMYHLKDDDLFLIPTAEVPVTNMHRDEVLKEADLPIYYTAYTACFRREAGSYGKDTKGLTRVHQFNKVEMVKFVKPEDSYGELEKLVLDAEKVLQLLGLPYRLVLLSTQDLSFAATKCYDLEAYAKGSDTYLEVSSCSNFTDFQARRANIQYRRTSDKKLSYVHTLNGSGIATARTMIAILENYQQADGSIKIPEALIPYMDGKTRISK
ncbi:MAG: serine--tRNA ligase [Candidatus Omnitrophica bacterium]|nr:serine--tRNA ligase [Candidatus Omnitrophota bacterium]